MSRRASEWSSAKIKRYLAAENPDLTKKIKETLLELAGNRPLLVSRLNSDTFRLYSTYKRGLGKVEWQKLSADRTFGRKVLRSLTRHAEELLKRLRSLPLNLKLQMEGDTSAYIQQIANLLADVENAKSFEPTAKGAPRNFDATAVEYAASRIFKEYTGRNKASLTYNNYKVGDEGDYLEFVDKLFAAMGIKATASSTIRGRLKKQRMAKRPPT